MDNNASTLDTLEQEIIEDFAVFSDWSERYQYLIDLGKQLPTLPTEFQQDQFLLAGCQSRVWVAFEAKEGCLKIHAQSDSSIVAGLIALVLRVFDLQAPGTIARHSVRFVDAIGLGGNLSMTRKNGLQALLKKIQAEARARVTAVSDVH